MVLSLKTTITEIQNDFGHLKSAYELLKMDNTKLKLENVRLLDSLLHVQNVSEKTRNEVNKLKLVMQADQTNHANESTYLHGQIIKLKNEIQGAKICRNRTLIDRKEQNICCKDLQVFLIKLNDANAVLSKLQTKTSKYEVGKKKMLFNSMEAFNG